MEEIDPEARQPEIVRILATKDAYDSGITLSRAYLTLDEQAYGLANPTPEGAEDERPRTRKDCEDGPRPCPWVSCSQHLYLDVNEGGAIKLPHPHLEVWEMRETCALDVAARDGETLIEIGDLLRMTRERVRQIEIQGLRKLRHATPPEWGEDLTQMEGHG